MPEMTVRTSACLALLVAAVSAQDPAAEPGIVPTSLVDVGKLAILPREGDAAAALAAFKQAHARHEEGDLQGAAEAYMAFLGMPGRLDLPERYLRTVQDRVSAMRREAREWYDRATALYGSDRAKGIAELKLLAGRYGALPEGRAAQALWHSDALRVAIREARDLAAEEKKPLAVRELETAIRLHPAGLYRYEAKSLLVELGGPDLFEPGERIVEGPARKPAEGGADGEDDEDEGTGIIVSDDG